LLLDVEIFVAGRAGVGALLFLGCCFVGHYKITKFHGFGFIIHKNYIVFFKFQIQSNFYCCIVFFGIFYFLWKLHFNELKLSIPFNLHQG
jgi:hypothetical protein